jgi:hypothetical protein
VPTWIKWSAAIIGSAILGNLAWEYTKKNILKSGEKSDEEQAPPSSMGMLPSAPPTVVPITVPTPWPMYGFDGYGGGGRRESPRLTDAEREELATLRADKARMDAFVEQWEQGDE